MRRLLVVAIRRATVTARRAWPCQGMKAAATVAMRRIIRAA